MLSDPMEGHTAKAFDGALTQLRLHAVGMGGLVIDQVSTAVRALLDADAALAQTVLSRESQVNDLERTVDREAFELIALHQPVAGDLRMATAVSRMTVELERAGDESKKIARFAARMARGEPQGPVRAVARYLQHMAELTTGMLRDAVRALEIVDLRFTRQHGLRQVRIGVEQRAHRGRNLIDDEAAHADGVQAQLGEGAIERLRRVSFHRVGGHDCALAR